MWRGFESDLSLMLELLFQIFEKIFLLKLIVECRILVETWTTKSAFTSKLCISRLPNKEVFQIMLTNFMEVQAFSLNISFLEEDPETRYVFFVNGGEKKGSF